MYDPQDPAPISTVQVGTNVNAGVSYINEDASISTTTFPLNSTGTGGQTIGDGGRDVYDGGFFLTLTPIGGNETSRLDHFGTQNYPALHILD